MGLYRFLRSVGFEHEDITGGLLAEPPAVRLNEQRTRLENRLRQVYERLVRHRRALENLRRCVPQNQNQDVSERVTARLQRHERAYDRHIELLARLKGKLKQLRAKLV